MRERIEAMRRLILDEVNVKELRFVEGDGIVAKKVKCNYRTMGKKFGKQMKSVASAVASLTQAQIAELETAGHLPLTLEEGQSITVDLEDVEVYTEDLPGWSVANDGTLTVALDLNITPELRLEGVARELVRSIQQLRKDSGLSITDRIRLTLPLTPDNEACVRTFGKYITAQVLATSVTLRGEDLTVEKDG